MYDAESPGSPPSGFLHFELDPRNLAYNGYPKGRPSPDSRWTRLGGILGWLRPADGKGAYFGDHVRFFFAVGKTKWVASLHFFGRATTRLLARLLSQSQGHHHTKRSDQQPPSLGVCPTGAPSCSTLLAIVW
jgi:hypothetical protein